MRKYIIVFTALFLPIKLFSQYEMMFPSQSPLGYNGRMRSITPILLEKNTFSLGFFGGYSFTTNFVSPEYYNLGTNLRFLYFFEKYNFSTLQGNINIGYGILKRRFGGTWGGEIYLSTRNASSSITRKRPGQETEKDTPQAMGDIIISPKFSYTFEGDIASVGGLIGVGIYSRIREPLPFFPPSIIFPQIMGEFFLKNIFKKEKNYLPKLNPRVFLTLGYTIDKSQELGKVEEIPPDVKTALYIYPKDRINFTTGFEIGNSISIFRSISFFLEWSFYYFIPPGEEGFSYQPMFITPGIKLRPLDFFLKRDTPLYLTIIGDFNISRRISIPGLRGGETVMLNSPPWAVFGGINFLWTPQEIVVGEVKRPEFGKIRGIVIDEETGAPIGEAIINYVGLGLTDQSTDPRSGAFISYDLPPGVVEIQARKEGYETAKITASVEKDKTTEVIIRLKKLRVVGILEGTVRDTKGVPVGAKIEIVGKNIPPAFSDTQTGKYLINLAPGPVRIKVSAYGYKTFETQVEIVARAKTTLDVILEPEKKEEEIKIATPPKEIEKPKRVFLEKIQKKILLAEKILFEPASPKILPVSFSILDELVDFLKENPDLRVRIEVHIDPTLTPDKDLDLTQKRAKEIYDYLVSKGIPAERLEYKGYGSTQPIAPNDTPEGRAKNRRVEFTVIE